MRRVYLDHAAAAPLDREVLGGMFQYFLSAYGNASSMHHSGRWAAQAVDSARTRVAKTIGADPEEIIFTGSGTEADNMAIIGCARSYRNHGDHIIISAIEHKAVFQAAMILRAEGFQVSVVGVDQFGCVNPKEVLSLVTNKTILVSIMYANNEIGTIEPVWEIGRKLHRLRGDGVLPLLHTDACQAAGMLPINVRKLGIDLMTLNGSKIYGPTGIGMLYKRKGVEMQGLIFGGDQEQGLRPGTENVANIVGFSLALAKAELCRVQESRRLRSLRTYCIEALQKAIPQAVLNGHPYCRLPNNIHFSIPCIEGESIVLMLDQAGIAVSTGSACSARDLKPSYVLVAIGQDENLIHGSIRLTMGRSTIKEDIDYTIETLKTIAGRLSAVSALTTRAYENK